jgi:AraC family transcriptional regulator
MRVSWYERMNKAIDYIEANLSGQIDFDVISKIMCQSAVNFQRTFSIVTDITVNEYIRRRRMTLAAFEMQNSNVKVIDLAMKYGYESPEAFTRAFKEIHGISPMTARKEVIQLKSYPRLTFLLTVQGDVVMDYRIESKEAFKVYGIERIFTSDEGKHLTEIPNFWLETIRNGKYDKLLKSTNGTSDIHAICQYRETGGNTFPYMLFAYKTKESETNGFVEVEVPSATWAIFRTREHTEAETSEVIQNLTKRVYTEWLPTANYEKVDGYELELYYRTDDGKCYCETWIRVLPK